MKKNKKPTKKDDILIMINAADIFIGPIDKALCRAIAKMYGVNFYYKFDYERVKRKAIFWCNRKVTKPITEAARLAMIDAIDKKLMEYKVLPSDDRRDRQEIDEV